MAHVEYFKVKCHDCEEELPDYYTSECDADWDAEQKGWYVFESYDYEGYFWGMEHRCPSCIAERDRLAVEF